MSRSDAARRSCFPLAKVFLCFWIALAWSGCNRQSAPTTAPTPAARPTVASLVPAATDILLDMGAGDHLVAVSDFDTPRHGARALPKVGDYQNFDWEQIATLRPDLMVTQFAEERMPQGLRQRQADLNIRPVNLHIDSLEDIFRAYDALGSAIAEPEKARAARDRLRARLESLRERTRGKPAVSVLIVTEPTVLSLAGPGSFLDNLLPYAGATNAAASLKNPYPTIDREMLHALAPDFIVQLLPDASPQVVAAARQSWDAMPELNAVKAGRVFIFSDWYLQQPGSHVADVAEKIEKAVRGNARGNAE